MPRSSRGHAHAAPAWRPSTHGAGRAARRSVEDRRLVGEASARRSPRRSCARRGSAARARAGCSVSSSQHAPKLDLRLRELAAPRAARSAVAPAARRCSAQRPSAGAGPRAILRARSSSVARLARSCGSAAASVRGRSASSYLPASKSALPSRKRRLAARCAWSRPGCAPRPRACPRGRGRCAGRGRAPRRSASLASVALPSSSRRSPVGEAPARGAARAPSVLAPRPALVALALLLAQLDDRCCVCRVEALRRAPRAWASSASASAQAPLLAELAAPRSQQPAHLAARPRASARSAWPSCGLACARLHEVACRAGRACGWRPASPRC